MSGKGEMSERAGSSWWGGKRVVVLGGTGFVGSHVAEHLVRAGARVRLVCRSAAHLDRIPHLRGEVEMVEADCANREGAQAAVRGQEVALHLAATVAGIEVNRSRPAWMFANNARLATSVFDACVVEGVGRVLYVSSACVYAGDASIPTPEEEGFRGEPETTNLGYGWAKRMGEVAARLYAAEYGLSVAVVRPYNAYGSRDNFAPETAHVIPSLIRRVEEDEGDLIVWGSGRQSRSFIYVEDLAEGILLAAERADGGEPVNLGSPEEIAIGELARLIVELTDRRKRVVFDMSKPDGHARRQPDLGQAQRRLGFRARTPLSEGLPRAIAFYRQFVGRSPRLP